MNDKRNDCSSRLFFLSYLYFLVLSFQLEYVNIAQDHVYFVHSLYAR
jgi:hypothetical protein